jgi:type IV secretory pathway VirB10-like protein
VGWRLRRSVKLMPGVRVNLSRRGLGYSVGPRGLKIGRGADGRYRRTVSLPGTGLYNTEVITPRTSSVTTPRPPHHDPSATGSGASPPASEGPAAPAKALSWMKGHRKTSIAGGALLLLLLGSASGGDGETPKTEVVVAGVETREDNAAEEASAETSRAVEENAAAEDAARAAAQKAAAEEAARVAAEQAAAAEAARVAAEQAAAEEAARAATQKAAEEEAARVAAEQAAAAEAARQAAAQAAAAQQAAAAPPKSATYYKNCTAARQAGAAPVRKGQPGYGSHLDRDGDGVGCEK